MNQPTTHFALATLLIVGLTGVGDTGVAITNPMPSDAPYVTTIYRLDSPHVVQGEAVWTDERVRRQGLHGKGRSPPIKFCDRSER